ncbi:MAG: hypothetical protein WCY32_05840 [Burkholderiaceae bacterium]
MREFDKTCLTPALPMPPERIRALREREHLSQPVFALYLNVSKNLVSDWGRGVKKPGQRVRFVASDQFGQCPGNLEQLLVVAFVANRASQAEVLVKLPPGSAQTLHVHVHSPLSSGSTIHRQRPG